MRKFIILMMITAGIAGCNDKSQESLMKAEATLRWTGDYAADGCGFYFIINGEEYKPLNEAFLDEHFKQQQDQKVLLEYNELLNDRQLQCGMNPEPKDVEWIEVVTIKRL